MEQVDIDFAEYRSFTREIEKFNKKYDGGIGYRSLKKLLKIQFHPTNPKLVFTPAVLRRIDRLGPNLEVYKITMRVKGLRSGQSPRICFRLEGNLITFLCHGTHLDNYKDSELKKLIKTRIKEIDPEVEFH